MFPKSSAEEVPLTIFIFTERHNEPIQIRMSISLFAQQQSDLHYSCYLAFALNRLGSEEPMWKATMNSLDIGILTANCRVLVRSTSLCFDQCFIGNRCQQLVSEHDTQHVAQDVRWSIIHSDTLFDSRYSGLLT